MDSGEYVNAHLLVTPRGLASDLGLAGAERAAPADPRLLVLDLRPAEAFAAGHVPGAVHLDLFGISLVDTDPAPLAAFLHIVRSLLASRGVAHDRRVVVYDERSGVRAARAFWFLEYFGHPRAQLLDGGFGAWTREDLPVSRDAAPPAPARWAPDEVAGRLATWRDVREALGRPGVCLLDVRSADEHRGVDVRARRGGAVPGAVHLEWSAALDERGAFRPAAELRRLFAEAGVAQDREVIAYCQGGYRAAHTYLALRLLGHPAVRNYVGSWKEWGDREDLPIERPSGV